jgi:two-component system CheB/CheR fusion protein
MSFPIVGTGASAGGLEAISELLAALPSRNGVAFVIVQHLGPDHESLLIELLAKRTPMPVTQAGEGIVIEPEHV